jgi:hypothetical protein
MTAKTTSMLKRARRLRREDDVIFVAIINNPEIGRLGVPMASNREALMSGDYYVAGPDETTKDFHARLRMIARERGRSTVILGDPENTGHLEETMAANPSYTPPNMSRLPHSTLN